MATKTKPRFSREDADVRRGQLIAAATRCLAKGGIAAFTIDRISREAGVSRGLINHHFKGIGDLLTSVYETMTDGMQEAGRSLLFSAEEAENRLGAVLDIMFTPPMFAKSNLRAWLALWGEIATNARLKAAHRKSYDSYRTAMTAAISAIAASRGAKVNAEATATAAIALIDGLWIEWCLDSSVVTRETARQAVHDFLESRLGALQSSRRLRRSI